MTEDEKYSNLYRGSYGRDKFKHLDQILEIMTLTDKSIVDVGCGTGYLRNKIRHDGYTGVDVASVFAGRAKDWAENEKFIQLDLRYPQEETIKRAEVSICLDVLEHIDEPAIDQVIKNILAYGKEAVIGVACFPHVVDGEVLHVTVREPAWWRSKMLEHTKIAHEIVMSNYILFFISDHDIQKVARIPQVINGIRIRRSNLDGSYFIVRRNREVEEYFDSIGIRMPNSLRWYLPYDGPQLDFTDTCYIVGKGPSLDNLRAEHFDGVSSVLCINDSIHKVRDLGIKNPVYMFQQDIPLKKTCIVDDVISILDPKLRPIIGEHKNIHYIHPRSVGATSTVITCIFAMNTAKQMGVTQFKFMCFDACVTQKLGYADCVGYDDEHFGGRPDRFLDHRRRINDARGDSTIEWIIPEVQTLKVSDKPQM